MRFSQLLICLFICYESVLWVDGKWTAGSTKWWPFNNHQHLLYYNVSTQEAHLGSDSRSISVLLGVQYFRGCISKVLIGFLVSSHLVSFSERIGGERQRGGTSCSLLQCVLRRKQGERTRGIQESRSFKIQSVLLWRTVQFRLFNLSYTLSYIRVLYDLCRP